MHQGVVAIIGGGPSGLLAALTLAREGIQTTLIERNPSVGSNPLKWWWTGNPTNQATIEELLTCYGDNGSFLRDSLTLLPPNKLMVLFTSMGLP